MHAQIRLLVLALPIVKIWWKARLLDSTSKNPFEEQRPQHCCQPPTGQAKPAAQSPCLQEEMLIKMHDVVAAILSTCPRPFLSVHLYVSAFASTPVKKAYSNHDIGTKHSGLQITKNNLSVRGSLTEPNCLST